jgi:hypothetical protein
MSIYIFYIQNAPVHLVYVYNFGILYKFKSNHEYLNNFYIKGTQEDKDRLGYQAIKKLHEKMDDDRDGQVEIQETKEVK